MNKENNIEVIDDIIPSENQIHIELPATPEMNKAAVVEANDYHTMLKDLILMALPSPSQRIH